MTDVTFPIEIFFGLCVAGAALVWLMPERWSPRVLAWVASAASLSIFWTGGRVLLDGGNFQALLWNVPPLGTLTVSLDRLSGLFLAITATVFFPVSIFSAGYLKRYLERYSLRVFGVLYFILFASIALILIAGDILLFLMAWETMSIASYLLVNFEHREEKNTEAGYLMLGMGEAGTLGAALALLLLAVMSGSLDFNALRMAAHSVSGGFRWAVFLLSFFGFGVKAGIVPFNSWLPRAHPAAPGNVSAILSAVILNLGIYGIVRVNGDLLPMTLTGAGLVVLVTGTISAFVGILYATTENDLKVMLAHSSIENMGIVTAGLGAGFVFIASGHPVLGAIAFVAALYHMTNHSLYKALLFLGAATVDARVGARDLDGLGGLIRTMPWTAGFFLVGALSIAALPPFNGFVSEWLTLQTLLRSVELSSTVLKIIFALCGAALALTAALAVTCFVKAFAMGFLGMSRSTQAELAREAERSMTAPMGVLAMLCLLLGVIPTFMIPALSGAAAPIAGADATEALVPPFFASSPSHRTLSGEFVAEFHDLGAQIGQTILPGRGLVLMHRGGVQNPVVFAMSTSYMFPVLLALLAISYCAVRFGISRRRRVVRQPRWDGGIKRLLPEMTYTATGFSNPVRVIFDAVLRPTLTEDTRETVAEHFRMAIRRRREDVHLVERYVFTPLRSAAFRIANAFASMHHGRINAYVAYGLCTLIVILALDFILAR
jgi:hydrogenase-4 component B